MNPLVTYCISAEAPNSNKSHSGIRARLLAAVTLLTLVGALTLAGCGGSAQPGFLLQVGPSPATITPGGSSQVISVAVERINGFSGTSAALPVGQVTATNNPQVALYTISLPFPGSVSVNFGPDTSYGHTMWTRTRKSAGSVSIYVAGMLANSTYHMAANVTFSNGISTSDSDHTLTTGAIPAAVIRTITTTMASGMTPQPGLELVNTLSAVLVTDLSGNTLWTYVNPGQISQNYIQGVKQLPNGDILMGIGPFASDPLNGQLPAGTISEIREVNLAGDTVREVTIDDLNAELAVATCVECRVTLGGFHHEITPLPNGHWLALASAVMNLSSTTQPALTNAPAQPVLADVVVDLDQNLKPVWVWNEFNHFDPNRHPMNLPDWTHTNAILYSADDGNILVSMRHQNWVVKVNYADGTGNGNVLWRLGQGGDFTLVGGVDPTDWQYAQHEPGFFSPNTSGVFSLGIFDNGNDRQFPAGVTCGAVGAPPCFYSSVPVFQIDESAMTATLISHQLLSSVRPSDFYSGWGGNAEQLANGNLEFDATGTNSGSWVFEMTQGANPQVVWSAASSNGNTLTTDFYRAFRIPSLYPGVQW